MRKLVFTISGTAGHGKDTLAKCMKLYFEKTCGKKVCILHFADYLKYICKQYYGWDGCKDEEGRTLLQQVGTNQVRAKYPNFWVDNTKDTIKKVLWDAYDVFIIPDSRFPNEIGRFIEDDADWHFKSIKVIRPDAPNILTEEQKNHPSETALRDYPFNWIVENTTLEALQDSAAMICEIELKESMFI